MALPCGHYAPGLAEETRAARVSGDCCPICPHDQHRPGVAADASGAVIPRPLRRQAPACRACHLSAGFCPCCGYHWTVLDGQARDVLAPVHHEAG
jgi:hypothetical protein